MTEAAGGRSPRRYRIRRPQDTTGEAGAQERVSPHEALKKEVARELGLQDDLADPDRLSVREAGKIGGHMVRRLIREGKKRMAESQGHAP